MTCTVTGCTGVHYAHGHCKPHYDRLRRRGTTERFQRPIRRCTIVGCERVHYGSGLCKIHYDRKRKHGTTMDPTERRFWAKVDKSGDCWLWTGCRNPGGYGVFTLDGRTPAAHRVAYTWLVGPIPEGLHIDHLCFVPACVNPAHLEAVTQAENNRRTRGRRHRRAPA